VAVTARCDLRHIHNTMPSRPPRADPTGLDNNFDHDDLFGGLEPIRLPPNLETGRNVASGSGSRGAMDAFGAAGISGAGNAGIVEEMDWEEDERQDTLIPELIQHWTNERLAPDILDQRGELLQRVLARIREQVGGVTCFFLFHDMKDCCTKGRASPAITWGSRCERG
jgi:hypothetical protein